MPREEEEGPSCLLSPSPEGQTAAAACAVCCRVTGGPSTAQRVREHSQAQQRQTLVPSLALLAEQKALAVLLPASATSTSPAQPAAALSISRAMLCLCVYAGGAGCSFPTPAVQEILLPDPEQDAGGGRLALGSLFPSGLHPPHKHISFPKKAPESWNSNTTVAFINFLA